MKTLFAMGFQADGFFGPQLGFPPLPSLPDLSIPSFPAGGPLLPSPLPGPLIPPAPAVPPPVAPVPLPAELVPPSYYPYPSTPARSAYQVTAQAPAPAPAAPPKEGIPTVVYAGGAALVVITALALLTR
jgi:hypothetical protein